MNNYESGSLEICDVSTEHANIYVLTPLVCLCVFSNSCIYVVVLLRRPPPEGRRLLVVATTAIQHLLDDLQLSTAFNVIQHVSMLQEPHEYSKILQEAAELTEDVAESIARGITKPLGVKQLLMTAEMTRAAGDGVVTPDAFMECLFDCGF